MTKGESLAHRLREVYLNGTWIANTNLQNELSLVHFDQCNTQWNQSNSIATLTQHLNYYLEGLLPAFQGQPLIISDSKSFTFSAPNDEEAWNSIKTTIVHNAESLIKLVETMKDSDLASNFVKPEYGKVERNIEAIIEHSYYHLGQIALLRKYTTQSPRNRR